MQKRITGIICAMLLMGRADATTQICSPFTTATDGGINACTQDTSTASSSTTFGRFVCPLDRGGNVYLGVIPHCGSGLASTTTTYQYTTSTTTNLNKYCFCRMVEPLLGDYVYIKTFSTTGECLSGCMAQCATVMTSIGATSLRAKIVQYVVGI